MKDGPTATTLKHAMSETEEIIFTIVEDLLKNTGIHPQEVRAQLDS